MPESATLRFFFFFEGKTVTLTGNDLARGRSHGSPLQLQRDGAAGGGLPAQSGRRAGREVVAVARDVERVVRSGSEGRKGAHGEVQDGAHRD